MYKTKLINVEKNREKIRPKIMKKKQKQEQPLKHLNC